MKNHVFYYVFRNAELVAKIPYSLDVDEFIEKQLEHDALVNSVSGRIEFPKYWTIRTSESDVRTVAANGEQIPFYTWRADE